MLAARLVSCAVALRWKVWWTGCYGEPHWLEVWRISAHFDFPADLQIVQRYGQGSFGLWLPVQCYFLQNVVLDIDQCDTATIKFKIKRRHGRLTMRIMVSGKIWMRQCVLHCYSLSRIKSQQLGQQIDCYRMPLAARQQLPWEDACGKRFAKG